MERPEASTHLSRQKREKRKRIEEENEVIDILMSFDKQFFAKNGGKKMRKWRMSDKLRSYLQRNREWSRYLK